MIIIIIFSLVDQIKRNNTHSVILKRLDTMLELLAEVVVLEDIDDAHKVNGSAWSIVTVGRAEAAPVVGEARNIFPVDGRGVIERLGGGMLMHT